MEFRRAEMKRVYRHIERVTDREEIRAIFEALHSHNLTFSMRVRGIGSIRQQCAVVSLGDEEMDIISRAPSKCRHRGLPYEDVESVEVVCNCEIIGEENDDGGRWARII